MLRIKLLEGKISVFKEPNVGIANWLPNKTQTLWLAIQGFFFFYPSLREGDPVCGSELNLGLNKSR